MIGFNRWYKHCNFVLYSSFLGRQLIRFLLFASSSSSSSSSCGPKSSCPHLFSLIGSCCLWLKHYSGRTCEQTHGMLGKSLTHWHPLARWERLDDREVSGHYVSNIRSVAIRLCLLFHNDLDLGYRKYPSNQLCTWEVAEYFAEFDSLSWCFFIHTACHNAVLLAVSVTEISSVGHVDHPLI